MARSDAGGMMATDLRTWDLRDFAGGLDLRFGAFGEDQTAQRIRRNTHTGRGREIVRRPPNLRVDGLTDTASQGLLVYQGRFYVFTKRGDTITHVGAVGALVENLEFDAPEYTTTWRLLYFGVHEGFPWAVIRHEGAAGSQVFIHVWDGLLFEPTYVLDPAFPANYTNGPDELAGQVYDPTFEPVANTAVSKVWISNLAGNVQSCRTADTRVWNQRDEDSLRTDGEHYCFRVPGGAGAVRDFHVPRPASDLTLDQRWSYYVVEKAVGEAWEVLREVSVAPVAVDTWQPIQVGMWGSTDILRVRVMWGSANAGLIRVRLVAGATQVEFIGTAPTISYSGSGATRTVTISPYEFTYRGGDKVRSAGSSFVISQGNDYLLGVGTGGLSVWNITGGAGYPTGWEREQVRLVEHIRWPLAEPDPNYTTATGMVAVTNGQPTITGTATAFTQEFRVGDFVLVNGERKKILTITSDTLATAETNFAATAGPVALAFWTNPAYRYAYENAAESEWFTGITLDYFDRAGAEDAVTIATRNHDPTGGLPSAIGTQLNRLLVFYPGSIQSWSVDQATNATAFLASLGFGTGDQGHPSPVPFYESVAVSLARTVRGIYVSGPNNDTLKDNNIGEKIEGLPMPLTRAACHWVHLGQLVVAATDAAGAAQFLVMDYSRESKISSWNTWDVTGLPEIDLDTLHPVQERLYFRAGNQIRYFDASAVTFRDFGENAGNAYISRARGHLNFLGKPGQDKRLQFFDLDADGATSVAFELAPAGTYGFETTGPRLDNLVHVGSTYGKERRPMCGHAVAVAFDLSSQEEAGLDVNGNPKAPWRVRGIGLTYQLKKR
jgi:hypothetical protein